MIRGKDRTELSLILYFILSVILGVCSSVLALLVWNFVRKSFVSLEKSDVFCIVTFQMCFRNDTDLALVAICLFTHGTVGGVIEGQLPSPKKILIDTPSVASYKKEKLCLHLEPSKKGVVFRIIWVTLYKKNLCSLSFLMILESLIMITGEI